ncbi:hypothetical protein quinque_000691 [Culex quinquefasciatus]
MLYHPNFNMASEEQTCGKLFPSGGPVKTTIEVDSVGSVQINSENEATSPSLSANSPIETPVGGSGKDGILCPRPKRTRKI